MDIKKMSVKAQEKFADQLMAVSTGLITATFVSILIVPLGAFINSYVAPDALPASWASIFSSLPRFNVILFGILYLTPLSTAAYARSIALKTYDRLKT